MSLRYMNSKEKCTRITVFLDKVKDKDNCVTYSQIRKEVIDNAGMCPVTMTRYLGYLEELGYIKCVSYHRYRITGNHTEDSF